MHSISEAKRNEDSASLMSKLAVFFGILQPIVSVILALIVLKNQPNIKSRKLAKVGLNLALIFLIINIVFAFYIISRSEDAINDIQNGVNSSKSSSAAPSVDEQELDFNLQTAGQDAYNIMAYIQDYRDVNGSFPTSLDNTKLANETYILKYYNFSTDITYKVNESKVEPDESKMPEINKVDIQTYMSCTDDMSKFKAGDRATDIGALFVYKDASGQTMSQCISSNTSFVDTSEPVSN